LTKNVFTAEGDASSAEVCPSGLPNQIPRDVLLVEDNVIIALDTEETLRELGVETVRVAGSPKEALEAIEGHPPQLALLDISLGGDTCYDVAQRLAELAIPFAFATGYREEVALPAPFDTVPGLRKPYTAEDLRSVMSALMDSRAK